MVTEMNRRIRYRNSVYTSEELQQRLHEELQRLYRQLQAVESSSDDTREVIARTYRDMIRQREQLFESLD